MKPNPLSPVNLPAPRCTLWVLLLALAACAAGTAKSSKPLPIDAASLASAPLTELDVRLAGWPREQHLRLRLPAGYEIRIERALTFEVFHVWRTPPEPLARDTSLGIYVGWPQAAYCETGTDSERPAAFRQWPARWHVCAQQDTGHPVWETHIPRGPPQPLHVFIIGPDAAELQRLRAIAETLAAGP